MPEAIPLDRKYLVVETVGGVVLKGRDAPRGVSYNGTSLQLALPVLLPTHLPPAVLQVIVLNGEPLVQYLSP